MSSGIKVLSIFVIIAAGLFFALRGVETDNRPPTPLILDKIKPCSEKIKAPSIVTVNLPPLLGNETAIDWRHYSKIRSAGFAGNVIWIITEVQPKLYYSDDCGENWSQKTIAENAFPDSVFFLNDRKGWLTLHSRTGDYSIFDTDDGGNSWKEIFYRSREKMIKIDESFHQSEIFFSDENSGFLRGYSAVWLTKDGGRSWKKSNSSGNSEFGTFAFCSPDENVVWHADGSGIIGAKGFVYRSTDGGASWNKTAEVENALRDVYFFDAKNGFIAGNKGIFVTEDGGENFSPALTQAGNKNLAFYSLAAIDEKNIWAAGYKYLIKDKFSLPAYGRSVALKSEDGGKNWDVVFESPSDPFFSKIRFIDEKTGWIVGRDKIYRTSDGGKKWKIVTEIRHLQT